MGEWKEYKLGDLVIGNKGSYGIAASAVDYDINKYTYLRITDIKDDGTINKTSLKSVDDINAKNYILHSNDIVFARTGASVGRSYFYEEKDGVLIYAGFLIKFSIDPQKVNPKLLKYYTHSQPYYDWIQTVDNGATRGNINAQTYASMPILLPERMEQDKIVNILGSLDDKIDLLHRENETLEAMAETLFRKWFIEDAKDNFEEKPLSSIAKFLNGIACQKYPPKNNLEKLPVLKIRELTNGINSDSDWATTDVSPEYIVHSGDIIFSWSASLMVKIWNGVDCILNQHLFKVTSDNYPKWFLYLWCKYHLNEFISIAESHATTMGHIKRSDLDNAFVLIPEQNDLCYMSNIMGPIFNRFDNNNKEIFSLVKMRDLLLHKLISSNH